MSTDDPLQRAIGDWQRKYRIADGDPMIAALELVRLYLDHSRQVENGENMPVPSFEDFRGTMESLDLRSKSFINQASDLVAELRRFGQNVERLNRVRIATLLVLVVFAMLLGVVLGRW
ncbi:MAG: hypothetical protein H0X34_04400 [Chthoniobacterales bacterium]|nr:hypothetical protein [Chthoniobacterales bacterium]